MFQLRKQQTIWGAIPNWLNFSSDEALFFETFVVWEGENLNKTLMGFEEYLLLFESNDLKHPTAVLFFEFSYKFEVIYEPLSILQKVILSNENLEESYELEAETQKIKKLQSYLAPRLIQKGFFNNFRILENVGKGSFGSVYLAERLEDKELLAVKLLNKQKFYSHQQGRDLIINEIQTMRELDHYHIMKLIEVYECEDNFYLVLEFIYGGSLYDALNNKSILPIKDIKIIIYSLLEGLQHIHKKEIIHRDIKLKNILFRRQNCYESLVIADFGFATSTQTNKQLHYRCGTPGYMAPEVINFRENKPFYSSSCDIYSAGLIFYLLLTGKQAFYAENYDDMVQKNKEAQIDFNQDITKLYSKETLDLLQKMLQIDPMKRITAEEALSHKFFENIRFDRESNLGTDIEIEETSQLIPKMNYLNDMQIPFEKKNKFNQMIPQSTKNENKKYKNELTFQSFAATMTDSQICRSARQSHNSYRSIQNCFVGINVKQKND